jgi:hypothetical protein
MKGKKAMFIKMTILHGQYKTVISKPHNYYLTHSCGEEHGSFLKILSQAITMKQHTVATNWMLNAGPVSVRNVTL